MSVGGASCCTGALRSSGGTKKDFKISQGGQEMKDGLGSRFILMEEEDHSRLITTEAFEPDCDFGGNRLRFPQIHRKRHV